jgi:hypothetical protein
MPTTKSKQLPKKVSERGRVGRTSGVETRPRSAPNWVQKAVDVATAARLTGIRKNTPSGVPVHRMSADELQQELIALRSWYDASLTRRAIPNQKMVRALDALDAAAQRINGLINNKGPLSDLPASRMNGLALFHSGDPDFKAQAATSHIDAARSALDIIRHFSRTERARYESTKRLSRRSKGGRGLPERKAFGSIERQAIHWAIELFFEYTTNGSLGKPFERFAAAVLGSNLPVRALRDAKQDAATDEAIAIARYTWKRTAQLRNST